MKIKELIPSGIEIIEGKSQYFISEADIMFKGIKILKDSLILNDGERIQVNHSGLGFFSSLIEKRFSIEKVSECDFELNELESGRSYIWHNNHFDPKFHGDYSKYFDRINELAKLEFRDITFSSFFYDFNYKKNILEYFISTKKNVLKVGTNTINLPENVIVARNQGSSEVYWLISINKNEGFTYNNILFKEGRINELGNLIGDINESISVFLIRDKKKEEIKLSKGVELIIEPNNKIFIGSRLFLESSRHDPNLSGIEVYL
jgi:hypothetical protein